jgi:hypothetical protein
MIHPSDRLKSQLLRILDARLEHAAVRTLRLPILEVWMKLVSMKTDATKEEIHSIIAACHQLNLGPKGAMRALFQTWIELA